jgi:hypothetical protein|tara:strand:+ start:764 stop:2293 length:1530 start_codon:yes stop_codon:yes gene_type:complete
MSKIKVLKDVNIEKDALGSLHTSLNQQKMKSLLDSTGPGFCLAKWTQVTMHLGSGLTHSCHHPGAHKIPLDELKDNPGALHNTQFKKERRKEMLNGERPEECDYCWRIEDNTTAFSDRINKSLDPYSLEYHDEIKYSTGDENIYPKYVEVSFGNVCNFKCSYCGPTFSSKWAEEIKSEGPYTFNDGSNFNYHTHGVNNTSQDNPYTDAFWKWFPEALEHMHTFRITGGEPLLNKHTFKVLEYLKNNPNPTLDFAINSNGNPPGNIWKKFTKDINYLIENKCIGRVLLFISAESTGPQAEFSRLGMNWDELTSNVEYFLENTNNTQVSFMSAFNIFSYTTFLDFLKYVLVLKKRYNSYRYQRWVDATINTDEGYETRTLGDISRRVTDVRVSVDIPFIRNPNFLDPQIATRKIIKDYMIPAIDYMYAHIQTEWNGSVSFDQWEAEKLKRIFDHSLNTTESDINPCRRNFVQYIEQYEQRNNVNFLETFPEMEEFLNECKNVKDKIPLTNE